MINYSFRSIILRSTQGSVDDMLRAAFTRSTTIEVGTSLGGLGGSGAARCPRVRFHLGVELDLTVS